MSERSKKARKKGRKLQVHYLSAEAQNKFTHLWSDLVLKHIFPESWKAKHYSIIIDTLCDSTNIE